MFNNLIGIEVMLGGNLNSFDAATYKTVNNYPSGETFTSTNYFVGQALVGPVLSFGDKFKFDIRALIGYVFAPGLTQTQSNGQSGKAAASSTYNQNLGGGFGYNFGAGINHAFLATWV